MKNHAASVHARLAQRRTKTGEDYNVVFEQEWEISLECQPIGIWPKNALESGDKVATNPMESPIPGLSRA
jgi:hypothetical protein